MSTNLLEQLEDSEISSLYHIMYENPKQLDFFWFFRSSLFLDIILKLSSIGSSNKSDNLIQAVSLDYLLELYGDKIENKELQKDLNNYILSIPGFNIFDIKQSDVTYEQHHFLTLNIIFFLNNLKNISSEQIIFDSQWLKQQDKNTIFLQLFNSYFPTYEFSEILFASILLNFPNKMNQIDLCKHVANKESQDIIFEMFNNLLNYPKNPIQNTYMDFLKELNENNIRIDLANKLSSELNYNNNYNKDLLKI